MISTLYVYPPEKVDTQCLNNPLQKKGSVDLLEYVNTMAIVQKNTM